MANRCLARWYDILAEYQPVFEYLPGAKNGIADALSRRPDLKPETKEFHDLLAPSFNETSYQLRVTEIRPTSDLIKTIVEGYKKDKIQEIPRVIEKRRDGSTTQGMSGKQYKVLALATYNSNDQDVHRGLRRQSAKKGTTFENPRSDGAPTDLWHSISMDCITDLPDTKRNHNSIWVVVDRLMKRSHFIPTVKTVSPQEVATLCIDNIRNFTEYLTILYQTVTLSSSLDFGDMLSRTLGQSAK
ncbi:unnamed protein product [Phytophthora fragariaefolia]|uniref:Unnamed protein product n=1 Tax=Phytophthora fragariaefolia TaxID=1490495 RepID=A0A9W6X8B3_9STRA|nr:unnamed protein product [Phytophthora fragariaefolia]